MQDETNTWTKWWWLRLDQWASWSSEERRAGAVLWLEPLSQILVFFFLCFGMMRSFQLSEPWNLALPLVAAVLITAPGRRGGANGFFGAKVQAGDAAAAKRLGGSVPEQIEWPLFASFWWLNYRSDTLNWSPEEIAARRTIWGLTLVFFFVGLFVMLPFLPLLHEVNQRAKGLSLLAFFALTIFFSRLFYVLVWPDDAKRADALAYERLCKVGRRRAEAE